MGIGASVTLLALGAILAFAVEADVNGLDIAVVGFILMAAGAIGLLLTTMIFGRRDRVVGDRVAGDRVVEDRTVTRERDVY